MHSSCWALLGTLSNITGSNSENGKFYMLLITSMFHRFEVSCAVFMPVNVHIYCVHWCMWLILSETHGSLEKYTVEILTSSDEAHFM